MGSLIKSCIFESKYIFKNCLRKFEIECCWRGVNTYKNFNAILQMHRIQEKNRQEKTRIHPQLEAT